MFKKKTDKMKNTIALKRSIYAVILSVIFIVAVVLITWLSTVLVERYPLELDLTTNKQHSISSENFDYIKKVKAKINMYVIMSEEAYLCNTGTRYDMAYVAADNEFVSYTKDNANYYIQTVELLKKYESYNDNIKVKFLDIYNDSSASVVANNFNEFNVSEGDICVEGIFTENGKEVTRRTVVRFTDVYTLSDPHGFVEVLKGDNGYMYQMQGYTPFTGYGYTISENKIETAVSSAIYKVTSLSTPVFLVPTTYVKGDIVSEALENVLEINNYDIVYEDGMLATLLSGENGNKYTGVILADCTSDISVDDRAVLESFLDNGGKKGKSLFFFAGTNTYQLTNLCGFLGDWGVGFEPGILYETNTNFYGSGGPTVMATSLLENDITKYASAMGGYGGSGNIVYMKQIWQSFPDATVTRETFGIMSTASFGFTTVMPIDADPKEWTPAKDAQMDKFVTGIVCEDSTAIDNKFHSSYVVAYASADMISKDWKINSNINFNVILDTFNHATGLSENAFNFVPKTIQTQNYGASVTEAKILTMKWIFMGAVPVVVVGLGIFVWIRRKRK